jgi:hypothetical protein
MAPGLGDLGIDIAHGQFVKAFAPALGPDGFKKSRWGSDGVDEIINPHNYGLGLASAADDKAFVLVFDALHNLAELGPGSEGRYDCGHGFSLFINDQRPPGSPN